MRRLRPGPTPAVAAILAGLGTAAEWAGNESGLWWVAAPTGLVIGIILKPRAAALTAPAVGLLGWGLPLALAQLTVGIGTTAGVLAGIMGLGRAGGWAAVLVTVLTGLLVTSACAWVGGALRGLVPRPRPGRPEDA